MNLTHKHSGLRWLLLSLPILFLSVAILPGCGDEEAGEPETYANNSEFPEAATEPTEFRQTLDSDLPLPEAEETTGNDAPERPADKRLAPFGVESARIVYEVKGDKVGRRVHEFRDYGLFDRTEDSVVALKENDPDGMMLNLSLSNPEVYGTYDFTTSSGWAVPNNDAQVIGDSLKDGETPFELFVRQSGIKQLPDTTINGYKTRVYRQESGPFVHTMWIWRDVVIRQHYFAPYENIEWRFEPVSIELNPIFPENHFIFPDDYKIRLQVAPPSGGLAPPPPELIKEEDLPDDIKEQIEGSPQ